MYKQNYTVILQRFERKLGSIVVKASSYEEARRLAMKLAPQVEYAPEVSYHYGIEHIDSDD